MADTRLGAYETGMRCSLASLACSLIVTGCSSSPPSATSAPAGAAPSVDAGAPQGAAPPLPPADTLQRIADRLVASTGAPGAMLAVARSGETWAGASGVDDMANGTKMRPDLRFRAGSITKMFTGAVIAGLAREGKLATTDTLDRYQPAFPNASGITVDMLLSHTAGVTTDWLTIPEIQDAVVVNLQRRFAPSEVIDLMAKRPPAGMPGASGMQYSNTGFVLLGAIAAQQGGASIGDLVTARAIAPLGLTRTTYQFDAPPNLAHGYFEVQGAVLDASLLSQEAIVSFAGAAGAVHATTTDLTRFLTVFFEGEQLVRASERDVMMTEGATGSAYGRNLMLFCPCDDTAGTRKYGGFGHGGYLPGYWSLAVYYPAKKLAVAAMINRDSVNGVPIGRDGLDAAAAALYDAVP